MLKAYLTDIANTIRDILGSTQKINAKNFSQEIQDLHLVGINRGRNIGKQEEYDRFWDSFQNNGTRDGYQYGFAGRGWSDETFKPRYDIIPVSNVSYMFSTCYITDLEKALNGVKLSFSRITVGSHVFAYCLYLTVVPEIDITTAQYSTLSNWFDGATALTTIRKIKVKEDTTYTNAFNNCTKLANITFDGVIGTDINLQHSPLTKTSMKNIISCLKDYSSTGGTHTLTLKADRENMLTDAEKAVATNKGWTLVWN